MCLTVTEVPWDKREGRIVPAWKSLEHSAYGTHYVTPFRYVVVARVGDDHAWLFPSVHGSGEVIRDYVIEGGYIHAHTAPVKHGTEWPNRWTCYRCYCFGVVAWGINDDLICRGMYIVFTPYATSLELDIHRLMERKASAKDVVRTIPKLECIEGLL